MPVQLAYPRDETAAAAAGADLRVLIVEDNQVNGRLACRILEKLGCRVDLAMNGAEGVRMQATGHYDAVFMDCQMPVMDGYEATRRIRARGPRESQPPIIAVTANAMPGDRARCYAVGMDDFIAKPFSHTDFLAALERWCGLAVPCLD